MDSGTHVRAGVRGKRVGGKFLLSYLAFVSYSIMQGTLFFSPEILLFRSQIAQIMLKPLTINTFLKVHDIVHLKSCYCLHFSGAWEILRSWVEKKLLPQK